MAMGDKTFNLRWNNHLANLSGLFEGLYRSGSLTDTTLACQGGMLRAHRLVLAACSPYFERVFKEHYGEQPILILKGVEVEEMECLLDFMYRGSIDVAEEHLASLIKTATDLEIRGLSAEHKNDGVYHPQTVKASSTLSQNRLQRCEIETRVQAIERRIKDRGGARASGAESYQLKQKDEDVKLEEIEDDPMVVETEDNFEAALDSADEQIRRIPPPMYKRETRYKGQKRVPVGRVPKANDTLDIKIKDCVSLKDMPSEDLFEESISLSAIKEEPTFGSCSDPTVPTVQLNEEIFEQDQDLDNLGSTSGAPSAETPSKSQSASVKCEGTGKRVSSKGHKAQYKPFSCDLCTLAFTRASHLARHRRVHTGERPFACTLCPRMFARQDKLKQHLDSHLQWPKRRSLGQNLTGHSVGGSGGGCNPAKGKRGRPRKISSEQSAMEEIFKFGEFSSLLNKSQDSDGDGDGDGDGDVDAESVTCVKNEASIYKDVDCSYGCQVENGHDVQ